MTEDDIRTQLPPEALGTPVPTETTPAPAAAADALAPALPALKDNEVRLSTGVIVGLRRLSGLDSSDLEQLMPDAGFRSVEGLAQATYLCCAAAFSISTTTDGAGGPVERVTPPETGAELRLRLGEYFEEDWGLGVYAQTAENSVTLT